VTRLVQLQRGSERRVAVVDEPSLRLLAGFDSVYSLANAAIADSTPIATLIAKNTTSDVVDYDAVYNGNSEWRLLLPIDHPSEAARVLVSGTGLTHLGSAAERQAMHVRAESEMTDSMKMFRWGVEGGKPVAGSVGIAPEWFYKGSGTILRGPGEALLVPPYADDGGEEGEIAGVYVVADDGSPCRVGMCIGNEFSDHRFEKKNYLNLAGSKLRTCSLGPEIVVDPDFTSVPGNAAIVRDGQTIWSRDIATGESHMCHSLENIEHHHFKYATHRRPGDVHVHYFGADSLSFGDGVQLADGDIMQVRFEGFGRPLRNPLLVDTNANTLVTARALA
jgi:hypothetical protein